MNHELLKLAQATGTDSQYRAWLQRQPSCICDDYSEHLESGEGRSIAAHWRSVAHGAGVGYKPPYCAIPITFLEHALAHQKGDSALMPKWKWEMLQEEYLRKWIESVNGPLSHHGEN